MRYTFILFTTIIFCTLISCHKAPQKTSSTKNSEITMSDTFSVAFYNAENLFDAIYNGDEYEDYKPGVSNWSKEMFFQKVTNTAQVIAAINPQIIGLCEVENSTALKALQKELQKLGCNYKYSAIGDFPLKTNTSVALFSKFPIKNVSTIEIRLEDGSITRNILETDIDDNEHTFKVFVNHWPAQQHPEQSRISAAAKLIKRLHELPKGTDYILIGDFNSNYDEFQTKIKHRKKQSSENGLNNYLNTIYTGSNGSISFNGETEMLRGSGGHYDLWLELPQSSRMSEVFKGYYQTLDHILLPSSLFDTTGISYVDKSFNVFTWNGKLLRGNAPFRWQTRKNGTKIEHCGQGYSDHLPVVARFCTGQFKPSQKLITKDLHPTGSTTTAESADTTTFEQSLWTICDSKSSLTYEKGKSSVKEYIHIKCESPSKNISIARSIRKLKKTILPITLQGSGKIVFRIRQDDGKWTYFNPPEYKPSKTAHYSDVNYTDWTSVKLNAKNYINNDKEIEIEVRAGKESQFNFKLLDSFQ